MPTWFKVLPLGFQKVLPTAMKVRVGLFFL